jgi:hypothetical protein
METTRYERVLNKIAERTIRINQKMGLEFKRAKPFDKEVLSARERLLDWESKPEEQKMIMRQYFPEQYAVLEAEMSRIKGRYANG